MFSGSFDRAYRRLVRAFKSYQDVPRSPRDIAVIGEARWELHLARSAMADERRAAIATGDRPVPARKFDVSDGELARLRVEAVSAGFS